MKPLMNDSHSSIKLYAMWWNIPVNADKMLSFYDEQKFFKSMRQVDWLWEGKRYEEKAQKKELYFKSMKMIAYSLEVKQIQTGSA